MPLASKDGKLYVKTEIDEDGNEVQKLCTSCCGDTPDPIGCCYIYLGDPDDTLQSQGRTTYQECQASQDEVDPSRDCVWIEDTEETKDQPCPDQPVYPPTPGICLYREDGKGKCTEYTLSGDYNGGYASEEEAQEAGDAACQYPDAPDCYACRADVLFEGDGEWSYTLTFREFTYDDETNEPNGCEVTEHVTTELECGGDPLADAQWENNLPATHCRPVSSEEECTESTGVFCPGLTECPDDLSEGCPETPIRSNPLP